MSHDEEDDPAGDVESYLRRLAVVVESANAAPGPAGIASALADAQRVAAWALRSAVRLGRARGLSWRQLAELLDIPASTLHRQYLGWALLTGLARKSMIAADPHRPGRFRMLRSLRAYGERVMAAGRLASVQNLLLRWLADVELRLRECPRGDELTAIERQIVAEMDNLRYAVTVAAARHHPLHPTLAVLLARFLANTFDLAEVGHLLPDVLSTPAASPPDRAHALVLLAQNDARRGDREAAVRHSDRALELAHGIGDNYTLALALTSVMMTRGSTGDLAGGIRAGEELIALLRRTARPDMTGPILSKQAWLLIGSGDLPAAREAITESIQLYESQTDRSLPLADRFANHHGMTVLHNAAMTAVLQRDDTTAAEYVRAVLTMPVPDRDYVLGAVECAALIAARRGRYALAVTLIAGTTAVGHPVHSLWTRELDAATTAARRAIGPTAARAAAAEGASLTVEQLIALALRGDTLLGDDPAGVLTRRELAVARRVAGGLTNGQIANELHISVRTVASHLANIRTKLGVRSRVDVALWVARAERGPRPLPFAPAKAVCAGAKAGSAASGEGEEDRHTVGRTGK
ncbi:MULTISPECIES: helix-turn-helix transcriptional regulator [Catenuloplanes]|uniref:DNA-binding CsgD family transcriptional regulator/tetratricopeptide (TPR) repeat protein n=1 Tax=Catenuloplanes niger TaxID=587534 RepID=A0AAE3ZYH3_9ACTN|nr:helix-turn-helix transcriptional regulator [Catenuloplanes niger]MDR7327156.1 DNA-binding CsgD family transcriptional regulator/tetratricopeptide (TPR) repeat protein [Catenuloplanes niger]